MVPPIHFKLIVYHTRKTIGMFIRLINVIKVFYKNNSNKLLIYFGDG